MASHPPKTSDITIFRWFIYVLSACFLFSLLLILVKSKPNILSTAKMFLTGMPFNQDSWNPMIAALKFIQQDLGDAVYDALFLKGVKFQYPLTSLLLFDLPERLTGSSYHQITLLLTFLSRGAVFGTGLISARILSVICERNHFIDKRISTLYSNLLIYGLVMLLTLTCYPLLQSFLLGQVQTLLTFLVALAILCWQFNKKVLVGVIIGFICLIKPQLGLLLIWAMIRRQWSMVIAAGIVISVFLALALLLYGFNFNMEYLHVLSFLSHHGESYYANQSVNGLMNRYMFNGSNLVWDEKFPEYSPVVYAVTLTSSIIFILFGLFWNYKEREPHIVDFCLVILCMTMASPIAWEHHYGIILPVFVVLSPFACKYFSDKRWLLVLLGFGYLLSSQYMEIVKGLADTPYNFVQSYLFFGACILLFFLFSISRKLQLKPN